MTVDIQHGLFTHAVGSRITVVSLTEDGGLRIRIRNGPSSVNIAELDPESRKALQDFLTSAG